MGAGRRFCGVQRHRKYLFCGEGLGIGRADCGPYRRSSAVGFRRRRPNRDGRAWFRAKRSGTPAHGQKEQGQARRRREGHHKGPGKPQRRGEEGNGLERP